MIIKATPTRSPAPIIDIKLRPFYEVLIKVGTNPIRKLLKNITKDRIKMFKSAYIFI